MLKKNLWFSLALIAVPCTALAQSDPCSTLADLMSKSNPDSFVGFGAGTTQKAADDNAQIDLASRIRQKVTATSTVTENNESSNLESTAKSVVSESLIGAKVLRRCNNNSETFSTVVTLEKPLFVKSLEKKLASNVSKGEKFLSSIEHSKNEEIIAQNIDAAKKFIAEYQTNFDSDLQLCKIYNGCADIKNDNVFSDLVDAVAKQGDKDQYLMVSNTDEVTSKFRDELVNLVEQDGTKVMDGQIADSSAVNRKIYAKCKANIGSNIPGTSDKVVNTTCTLEAYIGKQKKFRKVYSCKTMADAHISKEDAMSACSGRLQLQGGAQ